MSLTNLSYLLGFSEVLLKESSYLKCILITSRILAFARLARVSGDLFLSACYRLLGKAYNRLGETILAIKCWSKCLSFVKNAHWKQRGINVWKLFEAGYYIITAMRKLQKYSEALNLAELFLKSFAVDQRRERNRRSNQFNFLLFRKDRRYLAICKSLIQNAVVKVACRQGSYCLAYIRALNSLKCRLNMFGPSHLLVAYCLKQLVHVLICERRCGPYTLALLRLVQEIVSHKSQRSRRAVPDTGSLGGLSDPTDIFLRDLNLCCLRLYYHVGLQLRRARDTLRIVQIEYDGIVASGRSRILDTLPKDRAG